MKDSALNHFDNEYLKYGLEAQRKYPNEGLCRFMGKFFMSDSLEKRKDIKILEVGCGSGGNLWMIAKEGFDAYGIDGSEEAINICGRHLKEKWGVNAKLEVSTFDNLPFIDEYFDAVVDVVSLQHLNIRMSESALNEINRVLKKGGLFYSYRLSDGSCMYLNSGGTFEDYATIDNIYDNEMPLNNNNRMSFWSASLTNKMYRYVGFDIISLEKNKRSYNNMKMEVEYLEITAKKA